MRTYRTTGVEMLPKPINTLLRVSLGAVFGKKTYEKARDSYTRAVVSLRNLKQKRIWLKKHGSRYRSVYNYRHIRAGLTEDHVLALFDAARDLPEDNPVIVEIGSFLGRSAVAFTLAIKNKRGGKLYSIDPFNADSDPASAPTLRRVAHEIEMPLIDRFTENVKRYGSFKHVEVLRGYSQDFSKDWNRPIDLLYIDGDHSYEAVRRDFLEWTPFIKPGGFLAMHDVSFDPNYGHPDPIKVAQEFVLGKSGWTDLKMIRHLLIVRKASN